MYSSVNNGQLGKLLSELRRTSEKRRRVRRVVLLLLIVSLLLLGSLLTGCATPAPPPCEPVPNLPPPVAVSPMPTISYSLKAETLFKRWQQMLTNAVSSDKP